MIHVYAILEAGAHVPAVEGLDGRPIEARAVDGLTVAVTPLEEPARPTADAAVLHAAVVDALAAANDAVLPVQFGGRLVQSELEAKSSGLRRALERVRGCVEVGVRAARADQDDAPRASGGEYLRSRLAAVQAAERAGNAVHRPLADCARASVRRRTRLLLDASYLVPRESLPDFRQALGELDREPGLALVSTGPWPPYSFTDPP